MGLSSSQARLLNLTARMHSIEYKAQNLEAQKLQMANESTHVYQEYENALNKTKVQLKQIGTDGSATYVDATYNSLIAAGYTIKFADSDKVWITPSQRNHLVEAKNSSNTKEYFAALESGSIDANGKASDGVYEIYTASQLKNMTSGRDYRLMADIDMSGENWSTKNLNSSTFDGNGYSITGLNHSLFGTVQNATIKNLSIDGNTEETGLLAKHVFANSTISNISASGNIGSSSCNISNIGGFIGTTSGNNILIENCSSSVNIQTTGDGVGGFISTANSGTTITNCSSSGNMQTNAHFGGFAYLISGAEISSCSADMNMTAIGTLSDMNVDSGGFVASGHGIITSCVARGSITDTRTYEEGVHSHVYSGFLGANIGGTLTIENCDSYTNITTCDTSINGFAYLSNPGSSIAIKNCNYYGTVRASETMSMNNYGFAQANNSNTTITNCTTNYDTVDFSSDSFFTAGTEHINTITVTPPTITTTEHSTNSDADSLFDQIYPDNYRVLGEDSEDQITGNENNTEWLTNMLNAGMIYLYKENCDGELYQVNVATDTSLQEISDDTDLKKAEAKYEADMRKIDAKDKKFDTDLAAIDQERNAIKTEIDTLKTVAKDNVDRTFKLFF